MSCTLKDSPQAIQANSDCLKKGTTESRYRMVRSDGKLIWILVRLKLITNDAGSPIRMIGTSVDINETTLKEQLLVENEKLFLSLVTYVPIGIYITDLEGKCIYVNPAWEHISGMSAAEAKGDNWKNVIYSEDVERTFIEWKSAVNEKRNFQSNFRFYNKSRGIRYVSSRDASFSNSIGETADYVGTVEDVTEKVIAEKILSTQREKLVSSAKMSSLGEMASGIAHEINNPLMIIAGLCVRLKRMANSLESPIYKDVTKIESTAFRISKIIKGLKNFSRNSDKDPMESVPISRIIEDTLELSKQRFEDNQIELTVITNGCSDVLISARPSQITQVLLNLISNSFDAVEGLQEKWVTVTLLMTDKGLRMSITDSGNGIPKEVLDRMMDPFFTTKEVGKGTGLGLSISKGIIEEHGGRIYYEPLSTNTCFVIESAKPI